MRYRFAVIAAAAAGLVLFAAPEPASAMTLKECSTRYQAAKKDGTLNNRDWNTFRATECAAASPAAAPAASPAAAPATGTAAAKATKPVSKAILTDLPTAIDAKYAAQKPSQGRLHTCADSYKAHKQAGTLQGLRWIQKGGGFYSQCNRKLKGG